MASVMLAARQKDKARERRLMCMMGSGAVKEQCDD
jgi:hypothetical protein